MVKFKFIKNRINTKTKAGNAAQVVAGLSFGEIVQALQGDESKLKTLGEMHKEGEMFERLFPIIEKTIGQKIKNEKDWNNFVGQTVKDGSQAEAVIQRAKQTATLANTQYVNDIKEGRATFKSAIALEQEQHKWAIQYGRAEAFVALVTAEVEGKGRVLSAGTKLQLKQLKENRANELKLAEHYLEFGEDSNSSLVPRKDYIAATYGAKDIYRRVLNIFGI